MILELSFNHDDATKVICQHNPDTEEFKVLGISFVGPFPRVFQGRMVEQFWIHAGEEVKRNARDFDEFRTLLASAFNTAVRGGHTESWLAMWLRDIKPAINDHQAGHDVIEVGTEVRFYRDDGPRNSWVWKDSVASLRVHLK